MSTDTETDEWVDVGPASRIRGLDGMDPAALYAACEPDGARRHAVYGGQVRMRELMRIQRDHLAYQDDQRRYREYTDEEGRKRAEHVAEAVEKARANFIRRDPGRRAYQGPAGDSEGQMHRDPGWNSRLRETLIETTETVGGEYDKRHKLLTFGEWQQQHGTAP